MFFISLFNPQLFPFIPIRASVHLLLRTHTHTCVNMFLVFLLTITRNSSRPVVSSLQLSVYNRQVKVQSLNFFFSLDWTYAWQRGRVTGSCLFMPLNVWRATRKCPHALLLLLSQTLIFDTHHGGSTRLRDKINPFCRPQARLVLGSGSGWSAGTFLTLFDGVCTPCGVLASSSGGSSPETWVPTSGCLPGIQVMKSGRIQRCLSTQVPVPPLGDSSTRVLLKEGRESVVVVLQERPLAHVTTRRISKFHAHWLHPGEDFSDSIFATSCNG